MKSNLLYRGQESEYGYAWMEFARLGETVTLIIGMRAHRNTDGVRMSFYVTGKRLGADFGLLSADSRPLTERQLKAVLEADAWRRTASEYRDAVDTRLFGLGQERYAQLLDLLLALRRPLLAKDLDPGKVSDTLTSGLSPVDESLVQQAARDFENLAAVQKLFDDLTAANAAVRDFLTHYTAYLRAHVKYQLDRVQARVGATATHAEKITAAAAEHRRALAAEQHAEAERNARRGEGEQMQGRLSGLKNSEEYKAQGRIEDKRREVLTGARDVTSQRARLDRDRRQIGILEEAVRKLARRAAAAGNGAESHARDLADAAQRSGIADDGFGPIDSGDDLQVTARARVAARRDDVGKFAGCSRLSGTPRAGTATPSRISAARRPPNRSRSGPARRPARTWRKRARRPARARDEVVVAKKALDAAIAEVDAKTRQLRQAAAMRRMPTAAEQVDAIARAAIEFENAATQLHAERVKLTQAEEDLAAQTETTERHKLEYTYREALAGVLDYRSWHAFELLLIQPGEPEARLTRAKHSVMSGGEKSAAIHLPLFAAANALYSSAKDHCPRIIALDEAFVGIDERYKPDLFGLAVKFGLDLFMTGHDLWVTTAAVPMIAHYDMYHDKTTRTVSSLLMLWDGEQFIDAAAGYADNDALVTELLRFRPTRHAPLGTASTLYAGPESDADEDDDAESL